MPEPPKLHQLHQRALVAVEGDLYVDIAADADAADRLATARMIDREQRDPLIREMVRLFAVIRADKNSSPVIRALAAQGEAKGREAIRVDCLIDEHTSHGELGVHRSLAAGRQGAAGLETVLTGRSDVERCGRVHPQAERLADLNAALAPCLRAPRHAGGCVFLSIVEGEGDDAA
jgi:hypothetical protein